MTVATQSYREMFMFFTDLAYKSRMTLPILIFCGCFLLNMRIRMEMTVDTEHLAHDEDDPPPLELEHSDTETESGIFNVGDDSIFDDVEDFDQISVSESEMSDYVRTVFCLEVEIDHFYKDSDSEIL